MPKVRRQADRRIADLINEAQQYSNPKNRLPQPPSRSGGRFGHSDDWGIDIGELERTLPPPWFDPRSHPSDLDGHSEDEGVDVPAVDGQGEFPEPTPSEEDGIGAGGVEALAYYAPFHHYSRNHWGIYIRDFGLAYLVAKFKGSRTMTRSDSALFRCAYYLLLEHEYFHFQTEVAATRFEILSTCLDAYARLTHHQNGCWLEEAMANARAHQQLTAHEDSALSYVQLAHFGGFASKWMKTQPPGYRDFDQFGKSRPAFKRGQRGMTHILFDVCNASGRIPLHSVGAESLNLYKDTEYSHVPILRVPDSALSWLRNARLFPKASGMQVYVYTQDHPPAHVHVEFIASNEVVRLEWPSLNPLRGDRPLTNREERDLEQYLRRFHNHILTKLRKAYGQPDLPALRLR